MDELPGAVGMGCPTTDPELSRTKGETMIPIAYPVDTIQYDTTYIQSLPQWPVRLDQGKFKDPRGERVHEGLDILVIPGKSIRIPFGGQIMAKGGFYRIDGQLDGYHLEIRSGSFYIRLAYISQASWDQYQVNDRVVANEWTVDYARPRQWMMHNSDTPDHLHIDVVHVRHPYTKIHPMQVPEIRDAIERYYLIREQPIPTQDTLTHPDYR